ncbi:hypothetical protein G6F57_000722 [Rhizopus arrhizus]|uniref:Uncharacterized protein n=1 Tax=Rhizopus oryzae TaxID=64495 RepID=A0A9P7BWW1_RHIOR|nr:hypothetical protein G6F23_000170 [Rhizopus arrhizus]KAG1427127.1 hypothetical protein G6F58_001171 [Rhizopus delemar]KAG0769270.1 hypothetical protein G6F24_001230 [Rhizopus arrhizus]KAG0797041.1 hypothetical protein G6F21_000823 [Rhizopus arrhizus]KAG0801193.1 hypothetical protein G6F22_001488 [Rhizopus arrhizus]
MNLLTTEEDSVLASTQEFTADLFSSDVSSQEDIHMDTSSLEMEKIHDSAEATPVDQETDNAFQIKQSPTSDYIPGGQQHGTTVFNTDGALTRTK